MKVFSFRIFDFLLIFCLIYLGQAQHSTYNFSHITDKDGLSQNSIMAMHQDNLGQIWIGTKDGLNKFDGTEFKVYRHEKNNPNSISNNGIECIAQDSSGVLWVGTTFGLNKYNPRTNTFKSYFLNTSASGLGNNMIRDIKVLSNQEIWVSHFDGISVYDIANDAFKKIGDIRIPSPILETKTGEIYIGTTNGLYQCSLNADNRFRFKVINISIGLDINDIIESDNGNLLLATKNNNIVEYDIQTKSIRSFFSEKELIGKSKNTRKLVYDDFGSLWVATYNGIHIVDKQKNLKVLYSNDNNSKSLNDNFVKTLFKDNIGNMWVGTYYGGINLFNRFNNNFANITKNSVQKGLSFRVVSAIVNYKDLLLFGTEGGGVSVLNKESKETEHITSKNHPYLKSDNIKSLCVSEDGNLWIGTFDKGVFIYNLTTKRFEKNIFPEKLRRFLKDAGVLKIVQYSNNTILIGTNRMGLVKFNIKKKTFFIYNTKSQPVGLTTNNIKTILVDNQKNIWLGTLRGLNCITSKNEVKNYTLSNSSNFKFEINTIFKDTDDNLWIGTFEDGLFKLTNNKLEHIRLKIGHEDVNGIRCIIQADNSSFWISTFTQGILKYNFKSKTIEMHFTKKEGLPSNEFNRDAGFRLGDDYYFGGTSGVTVFNENNIVKNNYVPQVVLTDFKIKNQSVSVNNTQNILKNTISFTNEVELLYNQGNFTLSFSIPSFINFKSNSYKYRLKGLETDWVETSINSASYTIQKPGEYTFEVKGVNSDGVTNEIPTTLNIIVKPAPWLTWWAYAIYSLVFGAIIYYLFKVSKTKTELKYALEVEHIEAQQIKKLNQAKLEFFTNISHEFKTPLTLIVAPLQQILRDYQGSSAIHKMLKTMQSNANHLLQLIDRLMDFRKYDSKQITLQISHQDVVKTVKRVYQSFSDYAIAEGYKYEFEASSNEILLFYDEKKLESVLYNLISNAFKYTNNMGEINVRVINKKEQVILEVEDNGAGIPEAYREKIFERFFELSTEDGNERTNKKGTGIGLAIAKNIVELHHGKIRVTPNRIGYGSVFTVALLKGNVHFKGQKFLEETQIFENKDEYQNRLKVNTNEHFQFEQNFLSKIYSDKKKSILLVEDNEELRKFIRTFLIEAYNVFEAENGKIGFKMAIQEPIDLIVSDVVMPLTTGIELCSLIKNDIRTSHIPIILLTAKSDTTNKIEGLESGANDYISKPFNIYELELRIKNCLDSIQNLKSTLNTHNIFSVEDTKMSSLDEKLYTKALDIIEVNISNHDFDVHSFCRELGVSRSVLFTKVKAWTDLTPKQFIHHLRLARAAQLLEKDKLSITQISTKVGFKDQKHFSKSFKAKYGKTPSQYLKDFLEQ